MKLDYFKLVFSIVITQAAGIIGSIFTYPAVQTWFVELSKPAYNPPNWVFGPVWTTLYFLMGISLYLVWVRGIHKKPVKIALIVFAAQLLLNSLWSILFFGLQSPLLALVDITLLWVMIVAMIITFAKVSPNAAKLQIPYFLWVTFATYLNYALWVLN